MKIFDNDKFGWVILAVTILFIGAQALRYLATILTV